MSDFAQILRHEQKERRKTQLGVVLLFAVIIFIFIALIHYL